MLCNKILILLFLLAVMTLLPSQGRCENWKEFFKDNDGTWYYDKDSIHYPVKKKILGLMIQNKEVINVWVRSKGKGSAWDGDAVLRRIYCVERECDGCLDPHGLFGTLLPAERYPIAPGSFGESLLNKVCP